MDVRTFSRTACGRFDGRLDVSPDALKCEQSLAKTDTEPISGRSDVSFPMRPKEKHFLFSMRNRQPLSVSPSPPWTIPRTLGRFAGRFEMRRKSR
jgi:hypothetical protein